MDRDGGDAEGRGWHDAAEAGPGRPERRTGVVIHDPQGLREGGVWTDLAAVGLVLRA